MDIKTFGNKIKNAVEKFKYAAAILAIGLILLMLPGKDTQVDTTQTEVTTKTGSQLIQTEALIQILQSVQGAGKVQVLLSVATGESVIYQTDTDSSTSGDGRSTKTETVITTDSQRAESGLISQVNPPTYLGAIVVCEGADSATVKFSITQAVAKITGLGSDDICVLKMK